MLPENFEMSPSPYNTNCPDYFRLPYVLFLPPLNNSSAPLYNFDLRPFRLFQISHLDDIALRQYSNRRLLNTNYMLLKIGRSLLDNGHNQIARWRIPGPWPA